MPQWIFLFCVNVISFTHLILAILIYVYSKNNLPKLFSLFSTCTLREYKSNITNSKLDEKKYKWINHIVFFFAIVVLISYKLCIKFLFTELDLFLLFTLVINIMISVTILLIRHNLYNKDWTWYQIIKIIAISFICGLIIKYLPNQIWIYIISDLFFFGSLGFIFEVPSGFSWLTRMFPFGGSNSGPSNSGPSNSGPSNNPGPSGGGGNNGGGSNYESSAIDEKRRNNKRHWDTVLSPTNEDIYYTKSNVINAGNEGYSMFRQRSPGLYMEKVVNKDVNKLRYFEPERIALKNFKKEISVLERRGYIVFTPFDPNIPEHYMQLESSIHIRIMRIQHTINAAQALNMQFSPEFKGEVNYECERLVRLQNNLRKTIQEHDNIRPDADKLFQKIHENQGRVLNPITEDQIPSIK